MILITIQVHWPPRNFHQIFYLHASYLGIRTHNLEIRNSYMSYSICHRQFKLWSDAIAQLGIISIVNYMKFIMIGIIIRNFLEFPIVILCHCLHGTDKFQFQLTVFSCSCLCNSTDRTINPFPCVRSIYKLAEHDLCLLSAESIAAILVAVCQYTVVASILTFQLTFAFFDIIISVLKQFGKFLGVVQFCQITCAARNSIIHHKIIIFLSSCLIHFCIWINADMLWRGMIILFHTQFYSRLEHLYRCLCVHYLNRQQDFDGFCLHMTI